MCVFVQAEIDENIKKIQAYKGVTGIIILNSDGECKKERKLRDGKMI